MTTESKHTPEPWYERFESKIMPEPNSGCWFWMGTLNTDGYGQFSLKNKERSAHRLSYALHKGPIPGGLEIDHLCRIKSCVNPDHLEPVTHAENMRRNAQNGHLKRTHCMRGHEFTEENTYRGKDGWRGCKVCTRARDRKRKDPSK